MITDQKKIFCEKLIENKFHATKAAIDAGYSTKSARSKASQLLMEKEVQEYLSELKGELREKHDIKVDELVKDFESIKDSNIADVFDVVDGQVVLAKRIKRLSDLPREITKNIKALKNTTNGIAVEMYCRDAALRDLAKISGLLKEKTEVEHTGKINLEINYATKQ